MTKPIDHLMNVEMNRKEFLTTLGFGAASVMGFSSIIHFLTGKSLNHHNVARAGFGTGAYGGGSE